ncbi:unnamed protein product [Trichobilharzia regenti]|nr:unnamed protein product [Trichobilharzia regenti]
MLSNENDSNYFFFDQIKPLKQDRNFANKHYVEYETYTVQNNLSTVKELKSYSQNVNDSAVAARKKQTSADISSNLNNYSNNSNTSTIMTKICPPTRRLTDDKSISKQINYYTWVEHSEQIVRDLSRLLHNQNVKAIKRPRILDYRLDATWEELIATTDDEMPRDWQVPTIKNAFDLWIQIPVSHQQLSNMIYFSSA